MPTLHPHRELLDKIFVAVPFKGQLQVGDLTGRRKQFNVVKLETVSQIERIGTASCEAVGGFNQHHIDLTTLGSAKQIAGQARTLKQGCRGDAPIRIVMSLVNFEA